MTENISLPNGLHHNIKCSCSFNIDKTLTVPQAYLRPILEIFQFEYSLNKYELLGILDGHIIA